MSKNRLKKNKYNRYFFRTVWIVMLCLISILMSRYILIGVDDMLAIGYESVPIQVEIPENANINSVSKILKKNGIIKEEEFFKLYTYLTRSKKKFIPGSYELNKSMDYQAILNHIQSESNVRDIIEVTFTEGMNIIECSELLEKSGICDKDEFLNCCNSEKFEDKYSFLKEISNAKDRVYKLEGYLFPDTYKFYRGEKVENIITKMLNNYKKRVLEYTTNGNSDEKINIKLMAQNKNMTVDKIIIIASLIQAEAADKQDMYKVSSVIYNRLNTAGNNGKNIFGEFSLDYLRIDATMYYPYRTKKNIPKNIASTFKSSYNTYNIKGLPPGPICNPGTDALLAAINPEKTDYYYYCHSKDGKAFYAKTNDTHLSNMKKAGL